MSFTIRLGYPVRPSRDLLVDERLERVAEAIWRSNGFSEETEGMPFAQRPEGIRAHYYRQAEAAIKALEQAE